MATGNPAYDPTIAGGSSLTVPATIDGTGLTTSVPLLVKNGNTSGSGVEVQVTGTAKSGYLLRDSAGTQKGVLGYVVSVSDWISSALAGEVALQAANGIKIQSASPSGGVKIWTASNTAVNAGYISVNESTGVLVGYTAASSVLFDGTRATMTGPLAISSSSSLTAVALQVAGDPNTGIAQINGADTLSVITGGVEKLKLAGGASGQLAIDDSAGSVLKYATSNIVLNSTNIVITPSAAGSVHAAGRFAVLKGSDVASASTLTIGINCLNITGVGPIDYITTTGWAAGAIITLKFTGACVVNNNTGAVPGSTAAILTATGANVTYAANTVLQLFYDGSFWIDVKKVN